MSTCARCGAPKPEGAELWATCGDGPVVRDGFGVPETRDTYKLVIACRDRQIAAQAALLRSVTGKLEEASQLLCDGESWSNVDTAMDLIDQVLEVLS